MLIVSGAIDILSSHVVVTVIIVVRTFFSLHVVDGHALPRVLIVAGHAHYTYFL